MKDIGYGKGYAYDHDADEGFSGADYWPEEMEPQTFTSRPIAALKPRCANALPIGAESGRRDDEPDSE